MAKNNKEQKENSGNDQKEDKQTKETKPEEKTLSELDLAKKNIEELKDSLKRMAAEFENYKKRVDKECDNYREFSTARFIEKMLPTIDSFELAMKNSDDPEKFKQGIALIYAELVNTLKNEGVEKIEAEGKPLDPHLHDAMMAVDAKDKEKGVVLEVLQPGYKIKGRVLRHAKVKISK